MQLQKHLFNLPESDVTFLNCATMSPQLLSVQDVGVQAMSRKMQPYTIATDDFFTPVTVLRQAFSKLINANDYKRIAIIPSVSYGMATVAKNMQLSKNQKVIIAGEQFPSNYYTWERKCKEHQATLQIITCPEGKERAKNWTTAILEAINDQTALVTMGTVHWADGTKYDLKAISKKAKKHGALLVLDGTQSIGALPFDIQEIKPDALIVAGYKWMMGPYGMGCAYFGEYFDNGVPIEENWINRTDSHKFRSLINYQTTYQPKAARYSMGEQSNFIHVPMLTRAIEQLIEWGAANIQDYTKKIAQNTINELRKMGCLIEVNESRCGHLFGVRCPEHISIERLQQEFQKRKIIVSLRGNSIRIAPHVYNEEKDFENLLACFQAA